MGAGSDRRDETLRRLLRSPYALAVPAAVLFCSFAVWNGFPILFFDSVDYLQRLADTLARFGFSTDWTTPLDDPSASTAVGPVTPSAHDDGPWLAGRSVWYGGAALLLSVLGGPGAIVFAQAYLLSAVLAVSWIRGLDGGAYGYAAVCVLLLVASTASAFAAIVLPDIFSGMAILAAATGLAWWDRLTRSDRLFLAGVAAFAAASHDSILAVLAAGLALAVPAIALSRKYRPDLGLSPARAAVLAAGVVGGLAASLVFHVGSLAVTGEKPLRLPFLSARLATAEVGRDYLAETCPGSGFALCDQQHKLGGDWIEFTFSPDPAVGVFTPASPALQRRLSDEQVRFAAAVVTHAPARSLALLTGAATRQAGMVSLRNFRATDSAPYLLAQLSPPLREPLERSRVYRDPRFLDRLSDFYGVVAALAAVGAVSGIAVAAIRRRWTATTGFGAALLAGLALNAAVCGVLASPYDRFQARVAWILPFAAAVLLREAYRARQSRPAARPAPVQEVIGRA